MKNLIGHSFFVRSILLLIICAFTLTIDVNAQCPADELVSGLRFPLGMALSNQGNLLVSETGTVELHSGRISIVDLNGNRRTLIDGLPCAINDIGEPGGPSGLFMRGRTLYVIIGVGDAARPGPFPGTLIPNPAGVSSPIFSSVLAIHFSAAVEKNTSGFILTTSNQQDLANGQKVNLSNGGQDKITIEMVADFPDYIPEPLPFFGDNIRHSNPFQLLVVDNNIFVTDGGRNLIWKVDLNSGSYSALAEFPNIPNPLFPAFGGPFVEGVPTGLDYSDGKILVTLFRGFPFPPGTSTVQEIDPVSGNNVTFISELRTAIGVMSAGSSADRNYFVMQHTSGATILPLFFEPGLLLHFESPTDPPTVIADCLTRPSSMVLDKKTGRLYITEVGGKVVSFDISSSLPKSGSSEFTGVTPDEFCLEQNYPNPFNPSTKIKWQSPISSHQTLKVYDILGNETATLVDEFREAGSYEVNFDAFGLSTGVYFYILEVDSPGERRIKQTGKMILLK